MDRKLNSLENLQTLCSKIHDVKHDKAIIEAFKIGSTTLKTILSDSGITLEKVDDVLADVNETAQIVDDIQSAIGEITDAGPNDELERELEELIADFEITPPPPEIQTNDKDITSEINIPEKVEDFDSSILRRLDALKVDFVNLSNDENTLDSSKYNENL